MMTRKTSFAYTLATLSLATMLTACGDDNNQGNFNGSSGMSITEGGRQVINDQNENSFVACRSSSSNWQQNQQQYYTQNGNFQTNGQIQIEYRSQTQNQFIGQNQQTQQNPYYYQDPYQYQPGYNYNSQFYGNQWGTTGGLSVSISIARGMPQTTNWTQQQQQQQMQHNGYYVAGINVTGLQYPVSAAQCAVMSINENTDYISGQITCQGAYQNAPQLVLNFGCRRR